LLANCEATVGDLATNEETELGQLFRRELESRLRTERRLTAVFDRIPQPVFYRDADRIDPSVFRNIRANGVQHNDSHGDCGTELTRFTPALLSHRFRQSVGTLVLRATGGILSLYQDSSVPRLRVAVGTTSDVVSVHIADNRPGIPDQRKTRSTAGVRKGWRVPAPVSARTWSMHLSTVTAARWPSETAPTAPSSSSRSSGPRLTSRTLARGTSPHDPA